MKILLGHIKLKKLDNGYYRASGIVFPPDVAEFTFIGVFNNEMKLDKEEDLQILGNSSEFYCHRIEEARSIIKREVHLKRLEVILGMHDKSKQA